MKIKLTLIALAILLSAKSIAQSANANPSLSIGVEVGIPASKDFSDFWGVGIGGSAKVAIPVVTNGAVTLSAGYISFSGKTFGGTKFPAFNTIPFKAGFRYRFPSNFYIEPQLGITSAKVKGAGSSESSFTYAINLGYIINNMIDLSARYEALTKGGTTSFIGLRGAFNIPL
ncbi:MAG: hypothetical protein JWQ09_3271 [Segetibacter sp.]|nr:hypothetical protein [Segetibacter sp.]